jgi:tRNA uridine 5-carboxymethylaminomethyl modification enzyme
LLRPEVSIQDLQRSGFLDGILSNDSTFYSKELLESIEIEIKYQGYITREKLLAEKMRRLEDISLDREIDFSGLLSISTEGRQKLVRYSPQTIGQASRIPGISPSDIHVLLLYMGR